jgi:hypothetical protein
VSDYRDDRGALRQRVEELEQALERSEQSNKELRGALRKAREPEQPPKVPKPHKPLRYTNIPFVLVAAAIVASAGLFVTVMCDVADPARYPEPARLDPRPDPPPESDDWGDRTRPIPTDDPRPSTPNQAPFADSRSCRCPGAGAPHTLAYRSSSGDGSALDVVEAMLRGTPTVELLLSSETVPPSALASKKTQLLMACSARNMVLAFGQRVTAWNLANGDAIWIATLPASVGRAEPGAFELECKQLKVTDGAITIEHEGGKTRLSLKDGERI